MVTIECTVVGKLYVPFGMQKSIKVLILKRFLVPNPAETVEMMITDFSWSWNVSAVPTVTSFKRSSNLVLLNLHWVKYGVITPMSFGLVRTFANFSLISASDNHIRFLYVGWTPENENAIGSIGNGALGSGFACRKPPNVENIWRLDPYHQNSNVCDW